MRPFHRILGAITLVSAAGMAVAQQAAPNRPSAEQDRAAMMARLGIAALFPGPSGDEKASNHANYDEATANPYPNLPDPLVTNAGRKVATAKEWWDVRRPEIVEAYEREVYGRVPKDAPRIDWKVMATDPERVGGRAVIAKQVIGHADNSAYPAIDVNIRLMLVTPSAAKGPVPVLVMFGPANWPAPSLPRPDEYEKIDKAMKADLAARDGSLSAVFAAHPGFRLVEAPPFRFPSPTAGDPPSIEQLIAAGWGVALLDPTSVQADNGEGLSAGVIGLVNKGQPRKPDDWGALRAWAWGAARALDYLSTDPAVDARRVGIEGVSRYGKAALLTAAFDQRFATVLIGSSGKGGATLLRRNYGEAVASLATGEYYWMAGNFLKYDASKLASGGKPLNAGDLPVDSHELIALVAPRPAFLSYGIPEKGDAHWLDHQGSFMAGVAAGPVYALLGAKDLGVGYDYRNARMPGVNVGLLDHPLAWRQHDGGHTDLPNMKYFIPWANRQLGVVAQ